MKKLLFIIIILLLVILSCFSVLAHPGRTDSSGGHYDRSTGEYHYHHGYPAHQHNNGVCPYDFNDNTDSNSADSYSTTYPTLKSTIEHTTNVQSITSSKKEPLISDDDFISYSVLLISLGGCIYCPFWIAKPQNRKDRLYGIYSFIGCIFMLCLSLFLIFA